MGCASSKPPQFNTFQDLLNQIKSSSFETIFYLDFSRMDNFSKQHIYTEILTNLTPILSYFDKDQKYPVFRFAEEVLPLRFPDFETSIFVSEFRVLEEVEMAIRTISGPQFSILDCVITSAMQQQHSQQIPHLIAMILISDFCTTTPLTASLLITASNQPISFIICGSGAGSYKKFVGLDVMGGRKFDNLHFVDYGKIKYMMGYYSGMSEEERKQQIEQDFLIEFFREVPEQKKWIDRLGRE